MVVNEGSLNISWYANKLTTHRKDLKLALHWTNWLPGEDRFLLEGSLDRPDRSLNCVDNLIEIGKSVFFFCLPLKDKWNRPLMHVNVAACLASWRVPFPFPGMLIDVWTWPYGHVGIFLSLALLLLLLVLNYIEQYNIIASFICGPCRLFLATSTFS